MMLVDRGAAYRLSELAATMQGLVLVLARIIAGWQRSLWYKISVVSQCSNQLKDAEEMGHSAQSNWDMSLRLSSFHRLLQQMVPVAVGWFQDVTASAAVVELVGCGGPPRTISSS